MPEFVSPETPKPAALWPRTPMLVPQYQPGSAPARPSTPQPIPAALVWPRTPAANEAAVPTCSPAAPIPVADWPRNPTPELVLPPAIPAPSALELVPVIAYAALAPVFVTRNK